MPFTSLDKALMDRAVRLFLEEAVSHKGSTIGPLGAWPNTAQGRKDKRRHDALARDAADVKALQARMIIEVGDASVVKKPRAPKVPKVPALEEAPAPKIPLDREHPLGSAPGPEQVAEWPVDEQTPMTGAQITDWVNDATAIAGELREDPGAPLLGRHHEMG